MTETFIQKLLALYLEFDKVNGPYTRKDGRQHIVLNNSKAPKNTKGKLKTISYPKAIIEVVLNRCLTEDETVDHIDKNPLNNDLSNLQILDRATHCALDAKRRKPIIVNCTECKKEFEVTRNQLRKDKTGFFCSRKCSGKYGASIQHYKREKEPLKDFKVEYYNNKAI